ncbi:hypothetical protein [Lapidilactobacillus gannanensis]|jgi:multisubunit Na+/H+ antiporter MnhE subunit|uniref:DUF1146 domain-containing protein n=1 Tax=Lapidilactobacillus gannanensis TaxID=2486002 RepID=A0ABW4BLC8_9LACO|nr:hypothetical protein [Lapidilactobacillus gannanensis]MCH4057943.1 hypothetical protein [Lactobacillaceae bacterium]
MQLWIVILGIGLIIGGLYQMRLAYQAFKVWQAKQNKSFTLLGLLFGLIFGVLMIVAGFAFITGNFTAFMSHFVG